MKDNNPPLSESMPTLSKMNFQQNKNISVTPNPLSQNPSSSPNDLLLSCPSSKHTYTHSNGNTSSVSSSNDNMRVAIRIRPALSREIEKDLPFR